MSFDKNIAQNNFTSNVVNSGFARSILGNSSPIGKDEQPKWAQETWEQQNDAWFNPFGSAISKSPLNNQSQGGIPGSIDLGGY